MAVVGVHAATPVPGPFVQLVVQALRRPARTGPGPATEGRAGMNSSGLWTLRQVAAVSTLLVFVALSVLVVAGFTAP